MKALILAAGLGTRLQPITNTMPKCLVEINGKSMLEFWIDKLQLSQIDEIFINTHHFSELVQERVAKVSSSVALRLIHEEHLLGTAGTLRKVIDLGSLEEDLLVLHCDNYSSIDLSQLIQSHVNRDSRFIATMGVFKTSDIQNSGMVKVTSEGDILEFIEKPIHSNLEWANAAIYILSQEFQRMVESQFTNATSITEEIVPFTLSRIQAHKIEGFHIDMGTHAALERINCSRESTV